MCEAMNTAKVRRLPLIALTENNYPFQENYIRNQNLPGSFFNEKMRNALKYYNVVRNVSKTADSSAGPRYARTAQNPRRLLK